MKNWNFWRNRKGLLTAVLATGMWWSGYAGDTPIPQIINFVLTSTNAQISFSTGDSTNKYAVEYRREFGTGVWKTLTNDIAGNNGIITVTDSAVSRQPHRGYRVCLQSPGYQRVVWQGAGTLEDPWIITSVEELQAMNERLDENYALGNDIECSGFDFVTIGPDPFTGSIFFRGYCIFHLSNTLLNDSEPPGIVYEACIHN